MPLLSPLTRSCPLSRLASSYRHRLIVPAISRPRTYSSEPPQITPDAALDPFYVTTPIFYVNAGSFLHSFSPSTPLLPLSYNSSVLIRHYRRLLSHQPLTSATFTLCSLPICLPGSVGFVNPIAPFTSPLARTSTVKRFKPLQRAPTRPKSSCATKTAPSSKFARNIQLSAVAACFLCQS